MGTGVLNPVHIAFLLVVLLMLFGAKRLPELGKSLGTGLRGFKESLDGADMRAQLTAPLQPTVGEEPQSIAAVAATAAPDHETPPAPQTRRAPEGQSHP